MAIESSSIPKNEIDVAGSSSLSGSAGRPSSSHSFASTVFWLHSVALGAPQGYEIIDVVVNMDYTVLFHNPLHGIRYGCEN